jgi:hypothetical protein
MQPFVDPATGILGRLIEIQEGRYPVCDTPITGVWIEGLS